MSVDWTLHTAMSDPGHHAATLNELPVELSRLHAVIQGLMVHGDLLEDYGLAARHVVRTTLPVQARLDAILALDGRDLATARPPQRRAVGTCRDFALLLASCLQTAGIPARVRCGFAAYFGAGWADHWVCEYQDPTSGTWHLSDAQVDAMQREKFGISFDPACVPRSVFLEAGRAW